MRATLTLILAVLLAAFAAGYLALSFQKTPNTGELDYSEIMRARREFIANTPSPSLLDPQALTTPAAGRALLDPRTHRPASAQYPYKELAELYLYSRDCDQLHEKARKSPELAKAWAWHRFGCGEIKSLPEDFFAKAPWVHPSGSSFAFMAWKSGIFDKSESWLQTQLPRFHVAEYAALEPAAISGARSIVAELNYSALVALTESASLVISKSKVLFRQSRSSDFTEATYSVYDRQELDRFLTRSEIQIQPSRVGENCLFREGNACWSYNLDRALQSARLRTLFLFALTLFLAVVLSFVLLRNFKKQQLEERRKRFALQALTHELRTPVAGLVLSAEILRRKFDDFGAETQDTVLRVFDDIQRLRRLTEASRHYLGALQAGLVHLQPALISDLGSWIEDTTEEFRSTSKNVGLGQIEAIEPLWVDPYWLSLCFRNLIENALAHGKAPIVVSLKKSADRLRITVQDSGECAFLKLEEMIRPFARGNSSKGLGLGLALVWEILAEMGGTLEFSPKPSRFTLVIPLVAPPTESAAARKTEAIRT